LDGYEFDIYHVIYTDLWCKYYYNWSKAWSCGN